ncbi:CvpA family protein [Candidatus Berkiella aquae]|uniref:Colicin V production protein n=1 Tax=Candidatus Berkiella aquae TaxID=295108 RepID=A0A0Q9YIL5_9GAMM|nr:CvpA family protein [Candidatus Berkiella aquae]MCS5711736.1 CvpA family protein [Candidatus Berkiella aquae]
MTIGTPDIIISGLILVSILIGIVRGFIKELISLITWIVAIVLASMFTNQLAEHMTFTKTPSIRLLCAFLLIFVGVVFVGAIFNYFIGTLVRKTPFSVADRVLGSIFGLFRGVVLLVILVLLGGLTFLPKESWWQTSYFIPRVQVLSLWLKEQLPEEYAKAFKFTDEDNVTKSDKTDKSGKAGNSEKAGKSESNKTNKKPETKIEKKND